MQASVSYCKLYIYNLSLHKDRDNKTMKAITTILTILYTFFSYGSVFARDGELPGDANCDGAINVLDIITIAHYYAGDDPDPFCFENADINSDGLINALDIILIVHIIQGHDPGYGTVTDIDGNVYQTVIINGREWMKENLRVIRYNNQDNIPTGLNSTDWYVTTSGAYAIYPHASIPGLNSDEEVLEAYGALYNWYAVDDARSLCPEGWSVPSDADWTDLINYVASQGFPNSDVINGAGNALKNCRQVNSPLGDDCDTSEHPRWDSDGTHHGFDEFGFSGQPGGYRWSIGVFGTIGDHGYWWSATEMTITTAWERAMSSTIGYVSRYLNHKNSGFSVRCFRQVDN